MGGHCIHYCTRGGQLIFEQNQLNIYYFSTLVISFKTVFSKFIIYKVSRIKLQLFVPIAWPIIFKHMERIFRVNFKVLRLKILFLSKQMTATFYFKTLHTYINAIYNALLQLCIKMRVCQNYLNQLKIFFLFFFFFAIL